MMISDSRGHVRSALTVVVAGVAVAIGSSGVAAAKTRAHITSVKTSGTSANPEITIHGRGFGRRPTPSPRNFPAVSFKSGCPTIPAAKGGHLYGTQLYFTDLNAKKGTYKNWTAGQYTPNQFLDCVGLVIDHWSNTKVRFHFGGTYGKFFPGNTYILSNRDRFEVFVRHATLVSKHAKLG